MSNNCIIWTRGCTSRGYGAAYRGGVQILAHRLAWIETYGEIPKGMDVLHKCDTPRCINPEHLFLGTQADNNFDKLLKGRWAGAAGKSKMMDKVNEIRKSPESSRTLAKRFGVAKSTILRIKSKQSWKHL